jgi:putative cardiolipin synthase
MNLDQRSRHLNTEVGLIIDSADLSQEAANRFDAMTRPENSYTVTLPSAPERSAHLVWRTVENGTEVDYTVEPAKHPWQRVEVKVLSLLPLDSEL